MRTARNNGFDQIVAAGYHENLNVMIKLVKGNTRREYNGFDHIARVVSIVVFLAQWCWSQFVNTRLCQVIQVSLCYRKNLWGRALFGKWRHNWLAKSMTTMSDSWYHASDELCTGLVLN